MEPKKLCVISFVLKSRKYNQGVAVNGLLFWNWIIIVTRPGLPDWAQVTIDWPVYTIFQVTCRTNYLGYFGLGLGCFTGQYLQMTHQGKNRLEGARQSVKISSPPPPPWGTAWGQVQVTEAPLGHRQGTGAGVTKAPPTRRGYTMVSP